eukprot:4640936-Prymnesium_polylepis.2
MWHIQRITSYPFLCAHLSATFSSTATHTSPAAAVCCARHHCNTAVPPLSPAPASVVTASESSMLASAAALVHAPAPASAASPAHALSTSASAGHLGAWAPKRKRGYSEKSKRARQERAAAKARPGYKPRSS